MRCSLCDKKILDTDAYKHVDVFHYYEEGSYPKELTQYNFCVECYNKMRSDNNPKGEFDWQVMYR